MLFDHLGKVVPQAGRSRKLPHEKELFLIQQRLSVIGRYSEFFRQSLVLLALNGAKALLEFRLGNE